jgi:hypothetical protein
LTGGFDRGSALDDARPGPLLPLDREPGGDQVRHWLAGLVITGDLQRLLLQ